MADNNGNENVGLAFLLVIVSGLCTAVGAMLVLCGQCVMLQNKTLLAGALGLSSGVMLYVSFVEILGKSMSGFEEAGVPGTTGSGLVYLSGTLCFFGGILLMIGIDKLVHFLGGEEKVGHGEIPRKGTTDTNVLSGISVNDIAAAMPSSPKGVRLNEVHDANSQDKAGPQFTNDVESGVQERKSVDPNGSTMSGYLPATASEDDKVSSDGKLKKMGLMTALAIGIHNFPEGLATFVATLQDPRVGAALAVAIGIHNIPEGLCVSIPIYYSTGSRVKALLWALLSGVSEPLGALLGYLVLMKSMGPMAYGIVFGFVGGMMVYICLHELIPTAHRYDPDDKVTTVTIIIGMAVMALSLVLFVIEPESDAASGSSTNNTLNLTRLM